MVDDPDEMGVFSPPNQQRDQLAADASDEMDFVAPPPKDLECSLCLQVLKDPTLTSCGHHFCRACIDRVIAKNHVCPLCKEKGFQTMLDKATDRNILALPVRCRMKFRGCQWEGELGDLDRHLDVREGDCGFVEVECEWCAAKLSRGDMSQHMEENAHKHLILLALPQGGSEVERRLQEKHAELLQQHLLRREEKMTQELVTVKCKLQEKDDRVTELQGKLQEQTKEYSKLNKKLHKQIQQTDAYMKEELMKMEKRISEPQQRVESLERTAVFIPPPVITMTDFEKHNRDGDKWFSPPFYSHIREYKMCIGVTANGWGDGKGTHVSVTVYMMRGEYDDYLLWPFRGDITVQLLNQRRDEEHVEKTVPFDHRVPNDSASRVVGQERANRGWGFAQVIAHTALGYNAVKNTEYLKKDCLKFRVTSIVVKSTK